MDSTVSVEQRLIKAIQLLAPDKQQAVLDFAEFLENRQSPESAGVSYTEQTPFFGTEKTADGPISLAERGIDSGKAAELRHRLQTFAEDWERPEMAVYDEL